MTPDIKIKDFYLNYIHNAKQDIIKCQELSQSINNTILNLYNIINEHKDLIKEKFNINLSDYTAEWNEMIYDDKELLLIKVNQIFKNVKNEDTNILIQLIKYCYKLKEEYKNQINIKIAQRKEKLTLKEYKEFINKYYLGVHKQILNGYGYKFQDGLGTYIINYYKIDNPTKNAIDFAETNKRKRAIIAKGLKPYDEKEAIWYKERNIPYDGIEYRVYLDKKFYYDFTFIKSKIFHKKELDYQRTEYVHAKLRGMPYQEMADKLCNNIEDIINLNVDIKYKLNILLYKYPEKYLNFVRNAEQSKYKY